MDNLARSKEIPPETVRWIEGEELIGGYGTVKVLLCGQQNLTLEAYYPAGVSTPPHAHQHESHCYILTGRVRAMVDGKTAELGPGDAVIHSTGAFHSLEALEDSTWIEVKSSLNMVWE